MSFQVRLSEWFFRQVHGRMLVFNDCREDPRIDRVALQIGPEDRILVITSAGCNALDYLLLSPEHVYAVDVNPRQNWLLALKLAGIRKLDYDTFFQFFGNGWLPDAKEHYRHSLRQELPTETRQYWDRHIRRFVGNDRRDSFYLTGPCGRFARLINFYIDRVVRLRQEVDLLFAADTVEEQREIYNGRVRDVFWGTAIRWLVNRDTTLALLGVPPAQRKQVEHGYSGGVARFVQDALETVFTQIPLRDNYFWRIYLYGEYEEGCCPEYLTREGFARLKAGLVDRVSTHCMAVDEFLARHNGSISRFVFLDHMDWLCSQDNPVLAREWQGIVDRASSNARGIWRSGGLRTEFVNRVNVDCGGKVRRVNDILQYHAALARELHAQDRVHTYGSFYIADIRQPKEDSRQTPPEAISAAAWPWTQGKK
jgi:S-adenosylmethionine-diacylglycerol 3-amino-3-carboxypropyl transferase